MADVPIRRAALDVASVIASLPAAGTTAATGDAIGVATLVGGVADIRVASVGGAANGTSLAVAAPGLAETLTAGLSTEGLADAARSGLLHLPAGPAMLLGLGPLAIRVPAWTWWPSQQVWRVTEVVSFVVAVAGYGYCRADADRRRGAAVAGPNDVVSAERPDDGL